MRRGEAEKKRFDQNDTACIRADVAMAPLRFKRQSNYTSLHYTTLRSTLKHLAVSLVGEQQCCAVVSDATFVFSLHNAMLLTDDWPVVDKFRNGDDQFAAQHSILSLTNPSLFQKPLHQY